MSRARVTLPMRLTGVVRARDVRALLAPAPQALAAAPLALVGMAERLTVSGGDGEMGIVAVLERSPLRIFEPSAVSRRYQSAGRPS